MTLSNVSLSFLLFSLNTFSLRGDGCTTLYSIYKIKFYKIFIELHQNQSWLNFQ